MQRTDHGTEDPLMATKTTTDPLADAEATLAAHRKTLADLDTQIADLADQRNRIGAQDATLRRQMPAPAYDRSGRRLPPSPEAQRITDARTDLAAQKADLDQQISRLNRARHETLQAIKTARAERHAARRLAATRQAAVPLAPLDAAVDQAKAHRDSLDAERDRLHEIVATEMEPGGDPVKLLEARRRLADLPTLLAYAEEAVHSAHVARHDAAIAHAELALDEARTSAAAALPAYEAALEQWQQHQKAVDDARRAVTAHRNTRHAALQRLHQAREAQSRREGS